MVGREDVLEKIWRGTPYADRFIQTASNVIQQFLESNDGAFATLHELVTHFGTGTADARLSYRYQLSQTVCKPKPYATMSETERAMLPRYSATVKSITTGRAQRWLVLTLRVPFELPVSSQVRLVTPSVYSDEASRAASAANINMACAATTANSMMLAAWTGLFDKLCVFQPPTHPSMRVLHTEPFTVLWATEQPDLPNIMLTVQSGDAGAMCDDTWPLVV